MEVDEEDLTQTREPDDVNRDFTNPAVLNMANYQVRSSQSSNITGRTGTFNEGTGRGLGSPTVTTSLYQPTSHTYQLLQQPTDANKFLSDWQPHSGLTSPSFSAAPPVTYSGAPPSNIGTTFRPIVSTFTTSSYQPIITSGNPPPINYRTTYDSSNLYTHNPSNNIPSSNYTPSTLPHKPYDIVGVPPTNSHYLTPNNFPPLTKPLDTFGPSPSSFNSGSFQSNIGSGNVRYTDSV